MAPVTESSGATRGAPAFVFGRPPQPRPSSDLEIVEIDDDDDDGDDGNQHYEQNGDTEHSVDEMDQTESDIGEEIDTNDEEDMDEDEDECDAEENEEEEEEEEQEEEPFAEPSGKVNGIDSMVDSLNRRALQGSPAIRIPPPSMFTSSGIQEALHPLRNTADRVTRQMQAFAEKLDRFKQQGRTQGPYQAAFSLIKSYQLHASDAIKDASRQNTLRKAKLGWSTNRESDNPDPKSEEDLRRLQLEVETWDLLLNLIAVDDPSALAHSKESQKSVFQNLHRYSTDREIWEQFLDSDSYATECVMILKWLEAKSKVSSQYLDSLIANLEAQADRGSGLWAHGWLYTKESIKGQKRLRAWPQPLEPGDPGLLASMLSSDNKEPLITQLDPDAVIRQKHRLQKQDQFYEQATWLTCWKMLRQGENWTKIQEWSQERLESWRAVSLCGSNMEKQQPSTTKMPVDDSMARLMNCRSQHSWRAACSALARNPNTGDYEKAVYALLSGETEPAYQVCKSWDDHIYVFYNHILISRYQSFCTQFSRKLSQSPLANVPYVPEPMNYDAIQKFLENLRSHEVVGMEARNPYLTVQAAILGKDFNSFFLSMADAASEVGSAAKNMSLVPNLEVTDVDGSAMIAARDKDAMRIIAHLYIIVQSLSYTRSDFQFTEKAALNVIAHAENLRQAELTDWIPLYVSFLSREVVPGIMMKVLIDITDPQDKSRMAKLLEKYDIDIPAVQNTLREYITNHAPKAQSMTVSFDRKINRDRVKNDVVLMPVGKKFAGKKMSAESDTLIRCLEWYAELDGEWDVICRLLATLYKRFYGIGMLLEAKELSSRMSLAELSRRFLGYDLLHIVPEDDGASLMDDSSILMSPLRSPSKKARFRRSHTYDEKMEQFNKNSTVIELENVILTYKSLEDFQVTWEQFELLKSSSDADESQINVLKERLHLYIDQATEYAENMIDKEFGILTKSTSPEDEIHLKYVRKNYLPDVILNYICAIYYGSLKLSRGLLTRSMELAVLVAEDPFLLESFVESGRMTELADALALASAAMVNSPRSIKRRNQHGECDMAIWDIAVTGTGENANERPSWP